MSSGFTLVEMLVVLFILGIAALLAIPALNATVAEGRMISAYTEMSMAFEYARVTSLSTGLPCRVTVGQTGGGAPTVLVEQVEYNADFMNFGLSELDEVDVEGSVYQTMAYPPNPSIPYAISFEDQDRFSGFQLVSAVFGSGSVVVFDAYGTPSEGGTMAMSYSDWQLVLNLDSITGDVSRSS